eukprot:8245528-Alexandrium_andersonii.AAC.1
MSASLVGSEMCIRDSTSSSAARRCVLLCIRAGASGPGKKETTSTGGRTCLLYTSDAADDM